MLRNASAKGMEKGSDVAFDRIKSTVVLATNTHRNFTTRANFRSKIPRKIREERIFAQQIASTTTMGIAKIREFRLITLPLLLQNTVQNCMISDKKRLIM